MDVDEGVPINTWGYPEFLYDTIIRMPSAKFMHLCNKLISFWGTEDKTVVNILVDEDKVSFFADGELKSSTIVFQLIKTVDKSKGTSYMEVKMKGNVSLALGLRYLSSLCKLSTLSDQVTIKLSSGPPAVFEYNITDTDCIRYYMIPISPAPCPLRCPRPDMAPPTTLKLRIKNVTFLKNVLEVLSDPFSKANFEFSSAGLELQAMDPSRCTLVVFQLCPEAFDPYICNSGGTSVGLNLANMAKAFSFANNDDIVTIKAQDGVEDVVIMFKSPDGSVTEYFKLNSVSVNKVPVAIPDDQEMEYQAVIRMPCAEFMHFCNQFSIFTEDMETVGVCISVDKDRVHFFTDGMLDFKCELIQTIDKSKEATNMEVQMKEKVSMIFGMSYMFSICKLSTLSDHLSDQVTIKLSPELPAVFEYNIKEMGYIRYYVVPAELEITPRRIAEEDKMQN